VSFSREELNLAVQGASKTHRELLHWGADLTSKLPHYGLTLSLVAAPFLPSLD